MTFLIKQVIPIIYASVTRRRYKLTLPMLLSALTALAVLLTLVVALTASYHSQRQSLYNTTLQLNNTSATRMSLTMDSLFQSMRASLLTASHFLRDNPALSDAGILDHLEYSRKTSSYFNSIFWVNTKGIVQNVSPPAIELKGKKLTTKASQEALAAKASYVSTPYISATGRLIVLITEPVFDKQGMYKGYIGGTIYLHEKNILSTIFGSNLIDSAGSYFYVVDPTGKLVFHPDPERLGDDVSGNDVVRKLMKGFNGEEKVKNTQGETFLAGFSNVASNGWGIVVQSPVETIYAQLNSQTRSTVIYMGLPFLIIMLLAMFIARRLAMPFAALADYIGHAADGQAFSPPIKRNHWNREAYVLTQTVLGAVESMRKQSEVLTHAALVDPLTGLLNRRAMEEEMGKWTANEEPFSLIVLDIDRFKTINDTLGHQVGDEVLKCLADVLNHSVRALDICCRYGGEEFVVLLPGCGAEEAFRLAERIRLAVQKTATPANKVITVSLGVAAYPHHAADTNTLFKLADEALYAAKEAGRNRTMLAGEVPLSSLLPKQPISRR
ncbi:sensor domain-containing diguanylate cyclase [Paenibacillus sp. MMS18-CY102]|uniref:sensor domain-containing diguanylate cyclase n=1 Tax=Paenibacillus sp. MMS18-CY102 TaxID=2682849 RepID=UPI0013652DC4|nr:sensor domain-containing diguanylate cyclase [Paenibacillus sp. MMS18-CY102]MWC27040.1 diguanylate cyclase [Paenibacillus sp. MMS18-CY102]